MAGSEVGGVEAVKQGEVNVVIDHNIAAKILLLFELVGDEGDEVVNANIVTEVVLHFPVESGDLQSAFYKATRYIIYNRDHVQIGKVFLNYKIDVLIYDSRKTTINDSSKQIKLLVFLFRSLSTQEFLRQSNTFRCIVYKIVFNKVKRLLIILICLKYKCVCVYFRTVIS